MKDHELMNTLNESELTEYLSDLFTELDSIKYPVTYSMNFTDKYMYLHISIEGNMFNPKILDNYILHEGSSILQHNYGRLRLLDLIYLNSLVNIDYTYKNGNNIITFKLDNIYNYNEQANFSAIEVIKSNHFKSLTLDNLPNCLAHFPHLLPLLPYKDFIHETLLNYVMYNS